MARESTAVRRRGARPGTVQPAPERRPPRGRAGRDQARRQVPARAGKGADHRRPGDRPAGARPAPRRPPPRPRDGHDDLRLPGLAARRPRPRARAQPRAARAAPGHATCPASTRSSAPPPPGAASSPAGSRARGTTACWACGTARRPASTARPTPCATATSSEPGAPAAASPSSATIPAAKSSTVPSASESLLASLHMPVFYPGDPAEVIDLGLHAWACSRASGLWSGLKIVTSVADAVGTADLAPGRVSPVLPDLGYEHVPNGNLLPSSLELERSLLGAAHRPRARLRARERRRQPHRGRARRLARHRRRRQALPRPHARAAQPRPGRARRSSAPASGCSSWA